MRAQEITLRLPAEGEYALIARLAVSGMGMLANLEVGLIEDLRTATDECCDCLLHQPLEAESLELNAFLEGGRLCCRIAAQRGGASTGEAPQDDEIARGILETLMPQVTLERDQGGVYAIAFSLPI